MSRSARITVVLSVLISTLLVVGLIANMDGGRAFELLGQANWGSLGVAFLLVCAIPFSGACRWYGVVRAQAVLHCRYLTALRASMLASVLNSFLPSKGGDVAKALYLRKEAGVSTGVGTVVVERMVDLTVLGCLGLVGGLWSGLGWGILAGLLLMGGVAVAFLLLLWNPLPRWPLPRAIQESATKVSAVARQWIGNAPAVIQTFAGSMGNWALGAGVIICLISALEANLGWSIALCSYPLAVLAGLLPLTVSGIGTRDSAMALLFGQHIPLEEAVLLGLGYTFFVYWMLSLICLPAVFWEVRAYLRRSQGDANTVIRGELETAR